MNPQPANTLRRCAGRMARFDARDKPGHDDPRRENPSARARLAGGGGAAGDLALVDRALVARDLAPGLADIDRAGVLAPERALLASSRYSANFGVSALAQHRLPPHARP